MTRDFRPRANAHAIGLLQATVGRERLQGRLAIVPDALLERTAQLGLMGLAHEVVALMVERGVQEEALVLESEMPVGLPHVALAQRNELLAFGESADGDRPFFQSDWHSDIEGGRGLWPWTGSDPMRSEGRAAGPLKDTEILAKIPNPLQIAIFFGALACTKVQTTV